MLLPKSLVRETAECEPAVAWLPSLLDLEPEQCWCLACGDELPCGCAERALTAKSLNGERLA